MSFDSKILLTKIKNLKKAFDSGVNFSDALVSALNSGNALMQRRIFNENVDIEGNSFGTYIGPKSKLTVKQTKALLSIASKTDRVRIKRNAQIPLTPYQRKRANKGRQIIKKDLEFEGSLRRSIEVEVIDERSAEIRFNNMDSAKIARGQENQITNIRNGEKGYTTGDGIKIFALDGDEKKQTNEQGITLIKQLVDGK